MTVYQKLKTRLETDFNFKVVKVWKHYQSISPTLHRWKGYIKVEGKDLLLESFQYATQILKAKRIFLDYNPERNAIIVYSLEFAKEEDDSYREGMKSTIKCLELLQAENLFTLTQKEKDLDDNIQKMSKGGYSLELEEPTTLTWTPYTVDKFNSLSKEDFPKISKPASIGTETKTPSNHGLKVLFDPLANLDYTEEDMEKIFKGVGKSFDALGTDFKKIGEDISDTMGRLSKATNGASVEIEEYSKELNKILPKGIRGRIIMGWWNLCDWVRDLLLLGNKY